MKGTTIHLKEDSLLQGGKYRIVRFINSGGFGCTYEAEHMMLCKRVAIKEFFVKDFCGRDERTAYVTIETTNKKDLVEKLKKKFIEEARSIFELHHPGIVRVTDVFEENDTAYYVMDYIEGKSLKEIVDNEGALPESRALGYIRQVSDALNYVHAHNRLHLDIKPGNIMIDGNDRAILIDFGASKQYDEVNGENTSSILGQTPGYAPLEQVGNDLMKFTPATDIYSLGATFYCLLQGTRPPEANVVLNEGLPEFNAKIRNSIRKAIKKSMCPELRNRPQNVNDFLRLLGENENKGHKRIDNFKANINQIVIRQKSKIQLIKKIVLLFYLIWMIPAIIYCWNYSKYDQPLEWENVIRHFLLTDDELINPYEKYKAVSIKGEYGVVNFLGFEIIPFEYEKIDDYLAFHERQSTKYTSAKSSGRWGIIDKENNVVVPFKYDHVFLYNNDFFSASLNGKEGLLDLNNNVVIPFDYEFLFLHEEKKFLEAKLNGKEGVIDMNNNVMVPFVYEQCRRFYDNEILFKVKLNGKKGIVDRRNNIVIPIKYDDLGFEFEEGLCAAKLNNKWGFIDKKGNVVIPFKYYDVRSFYGGKAEVSYSENAWCYIDKEGNEFDDN